MEYGHSLRGPRRQRGAAAMIAGVGLVAMLAAVFLTLDISNLYFAKRVLQKQADMAALDGVRVLSRCGGIETVTVDGDIRPAVHDSLFIRNNVDPSLVTETVEIGEQSEDGGFYAFDPSGDVDTATAVRVTLQRPFPNAFLPFLRPATEGVLSVSAAAYQTPQVSLSVGTGLAELDSTDSALLNPLLSALFGSEISLSLLDYQSLLDTHIALGPLAVELGLATSENDPAGINSLLTSDIALPSLLNAIANVLDGTVAGVDLAVTRGVLAGLAAVVDPDIAVTPGDVLNVEDGLEALVGAVPINTLELLMALAEGGAEGIPLEIDLSSEGLEDLLGPLASVVGAIANIQVFLNVLEGPQIGIGPPGYFSDGFTPRTIAKSAQIALAVNVKALSIPIISGQSGLVNLGIALEVASATSIPESAICSRGNRPIPRVSLFNTTGTAYLGIGGLIPNGSLPDGIDSLPAPDELISLKLTELLPLLTIGLDDPIVVSVGDTEDYEDLDGPYPASTSLSTDNLLTPLVDDLLSTAVDLITSDTLQLGGIAGWALQLILDLLGLLGVDQLLDAVATALLDLLTPLLLALDDLLFALLSLLGVSVGNSDITVTALQVDPPAVFLKVPEVAAATVP